MHPDVEQYPPNDSVMGFGEDSFQYAPWIPPIRHDYLASDNPTISQPQEAFFYPDQDYSSLDGSTLMNVDLSANQTPFKIHEDMEWFEKDSQHLPHVQMDVHASAIFIPYQNANVGRDDQVTVDEMNELDEEYNALQNQLTSIKNSNAFLQEALRDSKMHRQAIENEKVSYKQYIQLVGQPLIVFAGSA
jgi:hypothetical protein